MKPNKHIIVTDLQWRCLINALDVLDELVIDNTIEPYALQALKDMFPPKTIESTRSKLI